jgi:hypothetical protein
MKIFIVNLLVVFIVVIGISSYETSVYFRTSNDNYSLFFSIIPGFIIIIPCVYCWKKTLEKYIK